MLKKIPFITSVICALIAVFTFQINDSFAATTVYKSGSAKFGKKNVITQKFYLPKRGNYFYVDSSRAPNTSYYYVCLEGPKSSECKQLYAGKSWTNHKHVKFYVNKPGYYQLKFIDNERVGGQEDYVFVFNYALYNLGSTPNIL